MLGVPSFPAQASPQRLGSASSRNKVALKKGRSLVDWIKLANSGQDLQGFLGQTKPVTVEELRKHNTEGDCWMAIKGGVYNVTQYVEYHPGGVTELMKGAGIDATDLFDEVHKWVNYNSMLAKCYIGPLKVISNTPTIKNTSSLGGDGFLSPSGLPPTRLTEVIPRYDWYEKDNKVMLSIYTKSKVIHSSDIIVDCNNEKQLSVKVLFGEKYYHVHLDLEGHVKTVAMQSVTGNKIDILLTKQDGSFTWKELGRGLMGHNMLQKESERELVFRDCRISTIEEVTYNTKLYHIQLPENVLYEVPIGHHVVVKGTVQGMEITRSYTVVSKNFEALASDNKSLHLMIKYYPDGTLTPTIETLKEGDHISVSDCTGDFKRNRLKDATSVYLIAAGTGFTPMIRLINYYLHDEEQTNASCIRLLFANKQEKDILWKDKLDQIAEKYPNRFTVQYVLSQPSETWSGLTGRINDQILKNFIKDNCSTDSVQQYPVIQTVESVYGLDELFAICGPDQFTTAVKSMLSKLAIKAQSIHCFLA